MFSLRMNRSVCRKITLAAGALLAAAWTTGAVDWAAGGDNSKRSTALDSSMHAFCGMGVVPISPVITAQLSDVTGLGRGVVVANVVQGSPAAKAGLKVHDIVTRYDKQDVYSPEQLATLVRNDRPGREVLVTFVRAGKVLEEKVTLGQSVAAGNARREAAGRYSADEDRGSVRGERTRQSDPTPWTRFESLSISRMDDGRFNAQISYRDADKKIMHREFVGSIEEIRNALDKDQELPVEEREHLLRTIDRQQPYLFRSVIPRTIRDWFDSKPEFFHWPQMDF